MTAHQGRGPLDVEEIRARQLRILDEIAEHCERHGLRWFLYAGTLLGAVRHEGYIPWDDDIDLQMPRPDYERFCLTFPARRDAGSLSLRSLATTDDYMLPFAKVCDDRTRLDVESGVVDGIGVFVDIFPIDGWRRDRLGDAQRLVLRALLNVMRAKHLVVGARRRAWWRDAVLRAAQAVARPLSARRLSSWITSVSALTRYDRCTQVGVLCWDIPLPYPREAFEEVSPIRFEGRDLPAPIATHQVLTIKFGDYRQLPPFEQRVTNHRWSAYEVTPPAEPDIA